MPATTTSAPSQTPGQTPVVNITAAHIIKCANPKSVDHLPSPFRLGPLDHFAHTAVPTDLVYVYEKPDFLQARDFIPIARLHDAISTLLNYYPHLTGRLAVDPSNGVRSITKLGTGVSLFEASCDQPLSPSPDQDHIEMTNLPGAGEALIPPSFPTEAMLATTAHWDPSFDEEAGIQRGPLLLIQRTQFKCGGVAIGYRISHAVCAAEGCIHLYQDLCEIYRKLSRGEAGILDRLPHIISFGADRITTPNEEAKNHAMEHPPLGYLVSSQPDEALGGDADKHMKSTVSSDTAVQEHPIAIADTYLHYSPFELANLKIKATNPNDPDSWVSTFEALLAHLWQQTHQARVRAASDQAHRMPTGDPKSVPTPSFWTNINFSHSNRLDLAGQSKGMGKSHYFPNAVLPVFLTVAEDDTIDLYDAPLWQVAKLVHEAIRHPETASTEYALAVTNWMCDLPDKRLAKVDFNLFARWCFVNTDWSKYELYGERTALDRVEAVLAAPPFTAISRLDGFTTFVQARERGGIDVRLTMNKAASGYLEG
ncbi:hypothetical protein NEUTE1DRAFT_132326 [Neurospora tetrasperma FGSC 2508]|uniref:Transferase n=1 Tax=Neurospora tetrasperma (strain FGSC 2508 / ATCC MYA-4615 / P0657) TaxID=510951 RepID=F8MYE7_NEUT8|nr:uncharacterized protein NEUTE1DRAFT_132326 [Neurospora tetrasperma FGSC 2508]EGO51344.1 hypothetical protein NEUTE1DRAFT_132326 [Neurospora tetrasperma FGSC 2508]EGZ78689.1 hypothetical protein NEUTE2DRAFT_147801 [Neurospora tetrasperma FGSC 2509]